MTSAATHTETAASIPADGVATVADPVISAASARRGLLAATLVTMRPRQWVKNALVIAAPAAAGALGRDDVPYRVGVAFVAFSLLASGIYAVNDVRDADEDRDHPRKCMRPVAAGDLTPRLALGIGVALMLAGLVCCALIQPTLALVGAGYLALTLTYTTVWRRVVIADIAAIAGGFVLRALAGGVAAPVELSRWFVLVVVFSAVFVAAGKRHAEIRRASGLPASGRRRAVLHVYSEPHLRLLLSASMALAIVAYLLWAVAGPIADGIPWRMTTLVPFAACMLRYGALLGRGDGEAPEDLVFGDGWLRVGGLIWLAAFAVAINETR